MKVLWRGGAGCFDTLMCGIDLIWGGVRILQIWVGVTFRSLSWVQFFQLSMKFPDVRFLGRCVGYFRGHVNGINGGCGGRISGVGLMW